MTASDRWEQGSSFPAILPGEGQACPFPAAHQLYGSGRQALRALITFGRREYGWRLLHVPAFYCPEVVESVTDLLPVRRYDTGPFGPQAVPAADTGEAVVTVSYFGEAPVLPTSGTSQVIVDVTHDPIADWPIETRADFVFASLRKTLPLPDGGVVWSPRGLPLPPAAPPSVEHLATAGRALTAMVLKRAYLDGADVDKAGYLDLFAAAEAGLRSPTVSGISDYSRQALDVLPASELRRRRIANANHLGDRLRGLPGITVHARTFGVLLKFDDPAERDVMRQALINRRVYPALLWTLPPEVTPPRQLDLSRRMLYLHTDVRWSGADLDRVGEMIRQLWSCRSLASSRAGQAAAGLQGVVA
ncbi:hypothetical protein [Micromonospora marina]|uniref:hypothetical protein n=1 Tax=Micromonospora marina TaxID=307120 RepID=UPI003D722B9A